MVVGQLYLFNIQSVPYLSIILCYLLFYWHSFWKLTMWDTNKAKICVCSMFPRSTHETFAQKMYQTFQKHKRFSKPKLSPTDFTISHYAGDVSIKGSVFSVLVCQNWDSWIYALFIHFPGHISNWFILGQEQRLCCCWTSSALECFRMRFCSWVVSTSIRWIIKIEVLIYWNTV